MKKTFLPFLFSLITLISTAQTTTEIPLIHTNDYGQAVLIRGISHNGKWAVAETRPEYDGGIVIDLSDYSFVEVTNADGDRGGRPVAITDDGSLAAGTFGNDNNPQPAIWRRSTGEWEILPYDKTLYGGGYVHDITPDGRWAVGRVMGKVNIFTEAPALWNLTTNEFIALPGLPTPKLDTFNQLPNRLTRISADGRFITASVSPGGSVLYDREKEAIITPKGKLPDGTDASVRVSAMSPSATYLYGHASYAGSPAFDEDAEEYSNSCLLNTATGDVTLVRDAHLESLMVWGVDDEGTMYAGSGGYGTPMRDFQVYAGGYWYALDQILWQAYGIDYYVTTRYYNTGTPYAFSADGKVLGSFTDPNQGEGWILSSPVNLAEACKKVDLMANYACDPAAGSQFSTLSTLRMGFDRSIALLGDPREITLLDSQNNPVAYCLGASLDENKITMSFRHIKLAQAEYTVKIPAGMLCMKELPSLKNKDIYIKYSGRPDRPVGLAPGANTEFSLRVLDYSANTIVLPFENSIRLTEGASVKITNTESGEQIADLMLNVQDNKLILRSAATIPLFRFSDYEVNIPAGTVTDLGSAATTGNEPILLTIHGNYEEQPSDDSVLFTEDFNTGLGNKFIFYEGDHLSPVQQMVDWGFTTDTTPWWIARDSYETTDYAAVSHSWYTSGGHSDDWMILRRMYIPDETCRLTFDSQSYRQLATDHLHVYAIPSDKIYNTASAEAMTHFRANAELIYDKQQSPGANEETLEGDWLHNDLSLAPYAGKYIYLAFVNEDEGGSALFVDNIAVTRNLTFALTQLTPASVVNEQSRPVSVKLYVNSDALTFSNVTLTLLDASDNMVDTFTMPAGTTLSKEMPLEVTFSKPLPLTPGTVNDFTIAVQADDMSTSFRRSITDLLFATTKRSVLEEYSGAACGNCPDGILMIERLKNDFPDRVIPLCIRSYLGDALSPYNSDYATLLGLEALGAPSACVSRRYAGFPLTTDAAGMATPFGPDPEHGLWYDFVVADQQQLSVADLAAECTVNNNDAREAAVKASVRYAIDTENNDHRLVAVLTEDKVNTTQTNYRYSSTDPFYGEWGAGGMYGKLNVRYMCDDVVRNVSHPNLTGDPGSVPQNMKAGEVAEYTMWLPIPSGNINLGNSSVTLLLIDAATGYIDNAVRVPLTMIGSVNTTERPEPRITARPEQLLIQSEETLSAALYDLTGRLIAQAAGTQILLPRPAHTPTILRLTYPDGTIQTRRQL